MPRQPESNGPIQVVGHAALEGLLDLLPVAARHDCPATPALDDREHRLSLPLAIGLAGKGGRHLAARGWLYHTTLGPPDNGRNDTFDAQVLAPPAAVGFRIIAATGHQVLEPQMGQGLFGQRAELRMVAARTAVGYLRTQYQGTGSDCHRLFQLNRSTRDWYT